MGYYTDYTLKTDDSPWAQQFWHDYEYERIKGWSGWGGSRPPANTDFDYADSCKWYDWKKDMEAISVNYPNALFTLEGRGEEAEDLWVAYFMNGDSQVHKAQIVFPEPNLDEFERVEAVDPKEREIQKLLVEIGEIEQTLKEKQEVLKTKQEELTEVLHD